MKLEECLCYFDGNYIILVVKPRSKTCIPFEPSKHYNTLKTENHGEITLKLNPNKAVAIFIVY